MGSRNNGDDAGVFDTDNVTPIGIGIQPTQDQIDDKSKDRDWETKTINLG